MWELTSPKGLNFAVDKNLNNFVAFVCYNKETKKFQNRFFYNIGQPIQDPPIHKLHKDLPIGNIKKIISFENINKVSFICEYNNNEYFLEFDGTNKNLIVYFQVLKKSNHNIIPYFVFNNKRIRIDVDKVSYIFLPNKKCYRITSNKKFVDRQNYSEKEIIKIVVLANTVRDIETGLLYIVVNRAWIEMMNRIAGYKRKVYNPVIFIWDAAFNSLLASSFDLSLAEQNLIFLFKQQQEDGMLRQLRVGKKVNNLTGLPIVSFVVWKIYQKWHNIEFLELIYPKLKAFHMWLKSNRDKNNDGLLEWGSEDNGDIFIDDKEGGFYESGLDDSPMWIEAEWDKNLRCFKMNCIDLSSIFCLDSLMLFNIANVLKKEKDKIYFLKEYKYYKNLINKFLWDKTRQIFANRHWNGKFSNEISPTSFFPLLAKIPDKNRAKLLLKNLLNKKLFWGKYVIPSISKKSKYYDPDGDYWRGRIWPPLNYLVYEGVKLYDSNLAKDLHEKYKKMFFREWKHHFHVHENYSVLTGYGEPQEGVYARSCPFYTWGALLLLD